MLPRPLPPILKLARPAQRPTAPRVPPLPSPASPQSLYRNLLSISPVSKAIDYYLDWPKALHSTHSFNLLISLALRSASFATARRLFSAMRAESVQPNMETWKLHIRWLVRTGRWKDAWQRALQHTPRRDIAAPKNPIPLPLWLELFGSPTHGALRHWDKTPSVQTRSARAGSIGGKDSGVDAVSAHGGPLFRRRLVPRPCQRPYAVQPSRYRALMQVSPLLTASDQTQIRPRTIHIITQIMYQLGQRSLALTTALSYLESLPLRLRRCDRRTVVDLVNSHLSMATRHRKQGLKQHFVQRRILWKFLRARPDLVPTSTTLFLLLASLRGCRRSGTLAMQCLGLFENKWGPRVRSRLVRRRIASLALKEGRLDIVEVMMNLESRYRAFGDTLPRTVYPSRRRPWRTLFSRRGVENRRWHLIEEEYRRRSTLRSEP